MARGRYERAHPQRADWVGYLDRHYVDPALPDIAGPTLDASLAWVASALTTLEFTAASTVNESTLPGVSGEFTHELSLELDHALRTWLEASLKFTGDRDNYVGIPRVDDRYIGAFDLVYTLALPSELDGCFFARALPSRSSRPPAKPTQLGILLFRRSGKRV